VNFQFNLCTLAINGYGNFAWEEFLNISLVFIMGFWFFFFLDFLMMIE
jgi:hypothetical protein